MAIRDRPCPLLLVSGTDVSETAVKVPRDWAGVGNAQAIPPPTESTDYGQVVMDYETVGNLVESSEHEVIVLERVARAAGQTNWFSCRNSNDFIEVGRKFLPGSCVSVYFDGRIARHRYDEFVREAIIKIAAEEHDCVVGVRALDQFLLEIDFIGGLRELEEFEQTLGDLSEVYFGSFPGRDHDGESAVTLVVPDAHGVRRKHPY